MTSKGELIDKNYTLRHLFYHHERALAGRKVSSLIPAGVGDPVITAEQRR